MKKGLFPTWDEEREYRLSLLECRICGGNPSSVCECAKKLYFEKVSKATEVAKNKRSRTNTTTTLTEDEQLEQEWISHKGLVCSPIMTLCSVCPNGEWQSFCACAKAAWIKWKKSGGWKTGHPPPIKKEKTMSTEGWILKIYLETAKKKSILAKQFYTFSSKEKCDAFVFATFGRLLFQWARQRSDQWDELEETLGFKGRTDEKCLEILAHDPDALIKLWYHYNRQLLDEGDDAWAWEVTRVPHDPVQPPTMIGAYDLQIN